MIAGLIGGIDMKLLYTNSKRAIRTALVILASGCVLAVSAGQPLDQPAGASRELLLELKSCRHKIVYESNREGNFELYLMNADGSHPVNLTNTPDVDEVFPRPSPDGRKICFLADEGKGADRVRNLYVMNLDGSDRTKIAGNAREPCWSPDGTKIAFVKGEFDKLSYSDIASKGLYIYDLATGTTRAHPNPNLEHLFCLNWAPNGKWFVTTVHGGMGFSHAIVAIEADGDRVVDLKLDGCRPNIRPDGKLITWGHGDFCVGLADLDLDASPPRATRIRDAIESKDPIETYQVTWSPDGRYLAFTRGPKFEKKRLGGLVPENPGVEAPGWDICVADPAQKNRWVALTGDGKSCKQPNWVLVRENGGR
jgi:Tol biopolymer transport system component